MTIITRFAPSPTGRLHPGHAYSALFARAQGDRFLLRIEDIDPVRCDPAFEQGIYEDLAWLGLDWEKPVRRQSNHLNDYNTALAALEGKDLLYPCFCTRKDIAASASAPHGPEGQLYPGTCRHLSKTERQDKIAAGHEYALRLDLEKALSTLTKPLTWHDRAAGKKTATPEILGDAVLARKDIGTSYHLSVTLDDHLQGVTLVTRGKDLFYASHLHRLLQYLLDLNVPEWHHHDLLLDEHGHRFAKRDNSITLQYLRETEKKTPQDILAMLKTP